MKTFWLYYNNNPIDTVRCLANAEREEIIKKALQNYDNCPGINKNPRYLIERAEVKVFE